MPSGPPPNRMALWVKQGEEQLWVDTRPDGTFDALVPPGSFVLEIHVSVDSSFRFVGWYDGRGGMTTDPSQAFQVVVDDADVDGIDIRLPAEVDGLLCSTGSSRSSVTGRCT